MANKALNCCTVKVFLDIDEVCNENDSDTSFEKAYQNIDSVTQSCVVCLIIVLFPNFKMYFSSFLSLKLDISFCILTDDLSNVESEDLETVYDTTTTKL